MRAVVNPLRAGILSVLLLLAAWPAAASTPRLVLLGIDGASWNLLDAAIARGDMPHFEALVRRGVTAELETVEPVNSPTVWSSIATGRSPEHHGVTDFRQTADALRVPTIFERLAAQGVRVGLYDYLVTWPAQSFPDGFVIPGWLRRDGVSQPPDLFERAGVPVYRYSTRGIRSADAVLANALREIAEKPGRFVRLVEAFDPQVAAVTFYALDAVSHRFWEAAFPQEFGPQEFGSQEFQPEELAEARRNVKPAHRDSVHAVLRGLDGAVGEIAASLREADVLLVVSDHGFRADPDGIERRWTLTFESLMAAAGLDPERDGFEITLDWRRLAVRIARGDDAAQEAVLDRIVELAESLRDAEGDRVLRVEIARTVYADSLIERGLQYAQDALQGAGTKWHEPAAHAVVILEPEEELVEAGWPDAELHAGRLRTTIGELFQPADFSGAHDPLGVFVAVGGPIAPGAERGRLSVLEIAPLVAYLSGVGVPDDLEAPVPMGLLEPELVAAKPVRTVPVDEWPALDAPPTAAVTTAGEGDLEERLRSLGYAE